MELAVDREPKQAQEQSVVRDRYRHRGRDKVGAIAGDDEVDLVDLQQLCVDPGHRRRIALVVVMDELDRAAEETALGIDVVLPNLHREQRRFARGSEPTGQSHAKANRYRLGRASSTA